VQVAPGPRSRRGDRPQVEALLAAPRGTLLGHEAVRTILYYDWSMERLPYAFFLFDG